jgi:transcriptional regulator with PAS, ATPase and Fis domain
MDFSADRAPEISPPFKGAVTASAEFGKVLKLVEKLAPSDCNVLITGESGTGKELIARAIYELSPRRNKPFLPINCGALMESLLESELFGHERGAFTGAHQRRRGVFEQSHGGTLFLDEIGDTTPALQVKLLRVLQDGELRRIGGDQPIRVDVRVIAATNQDLACMVEEGAFRRDLFYRLQVASVHVPPLRDRVEDIPYLIKYFLETIKEESGKAFKGVSPAVLTKMSRYSWPGNVRELENMLKTAAVFSSGPQLSVEDFPTLDEKVARHPRKTRLTDLTFQEARQAFEKEYLQRLLQRTNRNLSQAARISGLDRKTIRTKIRELGI